jgi:predicted ATPase
VNDIYWTADQQRTITRALGSARGGTATVLAVEGGAGFGKSTLLAEVCGRAEGFMVSTAFGMDTLHVPFDILAQWGVRQRPDSAQRPGNPFVAVQRLREFLDEQSLRGPVLWCLDDLDSADPQSIEALVWLLRRACGERLLIAATNRALPSGRHPGWRRLLDTPARDLSIRTLRLDGLEFADAARLIAARCPELRTEAARRLWRHTDGNPLYLRSLMSEYDPVALTRDPQLPAPAEFARVIAARLERLDDAGLDLCEALAVLGPERVSVPDAVAVAGLEDPGDAVRHLVRADLIESRYTDAASGRRPRPLRRGRPPRR